MSQLEIWLVSSPSLSSWVHLEVLASTWRFGTSYSSPVEFPDPSVILEASWALTPWGMTVPLGQTRPAQVAFFAVDIQRRYTVEQLTFSADAQWSSWHDPELACFWVFSGGELIFSAVVCWPCSSRGRNNMFRDFGSLRLWTFHASCCKAQKCL